MVYVISENRLQEARQKKVLQVVEEKNIHNSLKFLIYYSQILGLFPINCSAKSYNKLKFKWISLKTTNTFLQLCLTCSTVFALFWSSFKNGYQFADVAKYAFYICGVVTILLYLQLSMRWSKLMNIWCQMDRVMNKRYGYPISLDKRLRICSVTFVSLSLLDYLLSIYNRYVKLMNRYEDQYDYKVFFNNTLPQLYIIVPINIATAMYCTLLNTHNTLTTTFNELFIIVLSISLALRFKQITQKLTANFSKFQFKSEEFWVEIREDYDRLSILCRELDENISYIILLSYSNNLFFLLIQLYQSLETVSGIIGKVYFITSFVYQIFKIVSVSLYAAWINDESLEPMNILNSVTSSAYNTEVKRLLMQISFDNVALTGCRMFKITRGIILSIAGAVVTYELVLIQFSLATEE